MAACGIACCCNKLVLAWLLRLRYFCSALELAPSVEQQETLPLYELSKTKKSGVYYLQFAVVVPTGGNNEPNSTVVTLCRKDGPNRRSGDWIHIAQRGSKSARGSL